MGMKFAKLAGYLEKLEGTASRLEMTRILADLFKKTSPEEARVVAYMTQGKLGPAYRSPDFGVADKMMIRALGEEANGLFKKVGDLGLVAERLSNKESGIRNYGIKDIYKNLMAIANVGGQGSQEKKITLIGDLVSDLDPVGAKYAVKMVLGKLRTGFSDMTVLDALSWTIGGDKKLRPEIEGLYNVRADLGQVAETVVKHRTNWTDRTNKTYSPELGTPVLMARAERAKNAGEIWERNGRCAVEYKLDGLRIQAHITSAPAGAPPLNLRGGRGVILFSRGLENVTSMYPDVVEGLKKQIKKECIVEGEMIALGKDGKFLPFQETAQRKRKYDISEMSKKIPLKVFLFDVLMTDKTDMTNKTNTERRETLEKLVREGNIVKLMPRKIATSINQIEDYFKEAIADGTEGIIAKKLDGPYQAGARDFNWIKYKKSYHQSALADTVDVVVMGYDVGQGKRSGFGIGDFLVGVYQPKADKYLTVAKVGTGLTDEEWKKLRIKIQDSRLNKKPENYEVTKQMECDFWVKPELVVEIQADEITKSPMHTAGYALRFPRLISFREKKPEDATAVNELERMYTLQKKGGDK